MRLFRSVLFPISSYLLLLIPFAVLAADETSTTATAVSAMAPVMPPVMKALPFDLHEVRLLDSPFKHAQEMDRQYLLSLDVDRLAHNFLVTAGLPSSAQPYGGWESATSELRGHFVGHYLSACAMMVAATGDEKLKANADRLVAIMAECQAKFPDGYVGAYPESFFDRLEARQNVWVPWYSMHKVYAGLLDMYTIGGNKQALDVLIKAADWAKARTDKLTDAQLQRILDVEQGGISEVFANLSAVAADEKYLKLAERFEHHRVLDPLAQGVDQLTGLHANTQIPKLIGAARIYELTGDPAMKEASEFFWNEVAGKRSFVTGGNSEDEHFTAEGKLSQTLDPRDAETCNTYNMLKLTRHLFELNPQAEYADYYERALYNHILASQNPETGMMSYFVPLIAGASRTDSGSRPALLLTTKPDDHASGYCTPDDSFWCCTGTGVENHAKYSDSIYFHDADGLYLNLFIPSELDWKEKGLKLTQETKFPEAGTTRLTFHAAKPVALTLHIRHPYWAGEQLGVKVNGEAQTIVSQPESYASLTRTWNDGDSVEIALPMTIHTEGFADKPKLRAILYGPLVLCAEVDPKAPMPVVIEAKGKKDPDLVAGAIQEVAGKPLTFAGSADIFRKPGAFDPGAKEATTTLIPFYRQYDKPYIVYWNFENLSQWDESEKAAEAEAKQQKDEAARQIDAVAIGDDASEAAHKLKADGSTLTHFVGRTGRGNNGSIGYTMQADPDAPMELVCEYWGNDNNARGFQVQIDGQTIASQTLRRPKPGEFFEASYAIPPELTHGKKQVAVSFAPQGRGTAGLIFGVKLLRAAAESNKPAAK